MRTHPRCRRPVRVGRSARRTACLIGLAWLLLTSKPLYASTGWPQPIETVESALYRFDFEAAERIASYQRDARLSWLYLTHSKFLKQILHPSKQNLRKYIELADSASHSLKKSKDCDFKSFALAELALQQTVVHVLEGNNWTAAWQARHCWSRIQELANSKEASVGRLRGLYQICLAALPERYQWLLKWLGMTGNQKEGLLNLEWASQSNAYFYNQSKVILVYAYRHLEGNHSKAYHHAKRNQQTGQSFVLWNYLLAQLEIEHMKDREAFELLKPIEHKAKYFPLIWWLLGRVATGQADYRNALNAFQNFDAHYQGRLYRHDASMRQAVIHELIGQKNECKKQIEKTKDLPEPLIDEDRSALNALINWDKKMHTPKTKLWLQLKMALDGGCASASSQILEQLYRFRLTPAEQVEWHYRKARMEHRLGHRQVALHYYQMIRGYPSNINTWMHVSSLLYEGMIREEQADYLTAVQLYQRVFTHKNYNYQASLEHKAQAGLNRIRRQ